MRKHSYKSTEINLVDWEKVGEEVRGCAVVVSTDVAKTEQYSLLMEAPTRRRVKVVRWRMPEQLREFVGRLRALPVSSLEAVLEPSGSYGEALWAALWAAGIAVYRVSPKRTHDAAEVYDGVPSLFDAKAAELIARLHLEGASERWPLVSAARRDLQAATAVASWYGEQRSAYERRLEGLLASHWPEALAQWDLGSVALWRLLQELGSPGEVARQGERGRGILQQTGGPLLKAEKIEALLSSAATTVGLAPTAGEQTALQELCAELLRSDRQERLARRRLERLARQDEAAAALGAVVGLATAGVLLAEVGDPRQFASASAYEKAAGLNLKERSSGRYVGQRKLTKRGSGRARRWLYLAVLRWVKDDPIVQAWYARKVARDGGRWKSKALTALMRKLIRALWYVARGEAFDSRKLFDVGRLGVAA